MIALARTAEEERKFRAAAYLLDREHDRSVLRATKWDQVDHGKISDEQRQQVRQLLRALRDGRATEARTLARRPAVQESLRRLATSLAPADFADLRAGEPLPPTMLAKVLAVELALDPGDRRATDPPDGKETLSSSWSLLSDPKRSLPIPLLTLEWLTEFDPRHCHFRNGKWE
jgi:hypothetical protein